MADTQDKKQTTEKPATKEKLRSIMEAASALTALGDEEGSSSPTATSVTDKEEETNSKDDSKPGKRYIPDHKKPDAALTFPEKVRAPPWWFTSLLLACSPVETRIALAEPSPVPGAVESYGGPLWVY